MNEVLWNEASDIIKSWLEFDGGAKVHIKLVENDETMFITELKYNSTDLDVKSNIKKILELVYLDRLKGMLDTGKTLTNKHNSNAQNTIVRIYFNDVFLDSFSFIEFKIVLSQ